MKRNILGLASNIFSLPTLKRRIVFSLTSGILGCFVLMAVVSYNAISTMQQNNIKMAMSFELNQQSNQLSSMYTNLLLITQQMTPQGNIGSLLDNYLYTTKPYERSVLSRDISSSIGLIAFSHPNVELVMYYCPDDGRMFFNNLPLRDDFSVSSLPTLASNMDIIYQPPHLSQCRFSADQVVSVTREVTFPNNKRWLIYVEVKTDISTDMKMLSKSVNTPYVLTLLDKNDIVRYSSNPNHFSLGQVLQLNEDSEITKKYKWNRLENYYDFNIALLVTAASYNQELYKWKNSMFVVFGATLLIMAVIAALLLQLIYKPLRIFKIEMDALGKGNLNAMPYRTGILEFDQLFEQFNKMKQHIQQLILDVEIKEKRKTELEVEKLSYQINPHFLMNTLDSVHWMAKMREQPEIDKVICTLNYMLSYNLGKTKESTTLRTEISVLRAYLELQQMRYEFQVILDYDEGEFLDYPVARFILQPIAENAICHGLNENGKIEINIRLDESSRNVIIRISDDGTGMSPDMLMRLQDPDLKENQHMGRGIGLRYVRLMLDSYYGRNAHMEIASEPGKGTTVTMYLPVRKETPS